MKRILYLLIVLMLSFLSSCTTSPEQTTQQSAQNILDNTIADLSRVIESPAIAVRGFGIVAGLFGTGSSECPPDLRQELEKYIWQQIPQAGAINPGRFIESLDTAVVEVLGVIPSMAAAGQGFDVVIRPLSSTQTTSLNGGYLYTTDLKESSRFTQFNQYSKTVARAQGPIFNDRSAQGDTPQWYVLGGGYSLTDVTISLLLNQPDFIAAGAIRNRINERFGPKTATAVSAGEILLAIPEKYRNDKTRFLTIIRQLYLAEQPTLRERRIKTLIDQLQTAPDKDVPEMALEGLGKSVLDDMAVLLKSDDDIIRFHAARCMSNIGDNRALAVLCTFIFDTDSPFRLDALRTMGQNTRLNDAEPIFLRALAEDDMELRLAAYETALAAKSSCVNRSLIAGNFFVDRVLCEGPKIIYAFQQDRPGIILFGSPLRCSDNVYLRSNNGEVTLNSRPGDKHLSVSRTHPARPRVIGPLASGFELTQVIRTLGESPEQKQGETTLPGLALSYSQIIELLEKMCQNKVVDAQYQQGPVTNAGEILKNM